MFKRLLFFAYGVACYLVFLATFIYAIAFVGGFSVPTRLDGALQTSLPAALAVDCLLLTIFAVQHSVMARPWFKERWTQIVPWTIERSTYVPESYGEDACELLVQSPRGLYAYWEVSPETQRSAGGDLVLRLRSRVGERELGRMPSAVGEWWIEVEPGDVYVLDLVASDGRVLLRSAPARPPAAGPSPRGEVRMVHRDRVLAAAVLHAPATAAPAPRAGPQALARPEAWRLAPLPALAPAEAEIDVALTEHPTVDQPPAPSHHASGLASATGLASADGAVDPTGPAGVAGSGSGAGPSAGRGSSEQRPRRAS